MPLCPLHQRPNSKHHAFTSHPVYTKYALYYKRDKRVSRKLRSHSLIGNDFVIVYGQNIQVTTWMAVLPAPKASLDSAMLASATDLRFLAKQFRRVSTSHDTQTRLTKGRQEELYPTQATLTQQGSD